MPYVWPLLNNLSDTTIYIFDVGKSYADKAAPLNA